MACTSTETRLSRQRRTVGPARERITAASAPPIVERALQSPGRPLDSVTRASMETRLGHDFSRVRVHTDALAAESASAVDALSYAAGEHIVFGAGRFAPASASGERLLAHELAHTVQQRGASKRLAPLTIGPAGDRAEQEADAVADAVAARAVPPSLGGGGDALGLRRKPREGGIESGGYSYSTNCGWIDWGHAQPTMANRLIDQVRTASARLGAVTAAQATVPGAPAVGGATAAPAAGPPIGVTAASTCPADYDPGEREASARAVEPLVDTRSLVTHQEISVQDFEIGGSEASRFGPALSASLARVSSSTPGTRFELYGFTDCLGGERRNTRLRAERAVAVHDLLPEDVKKRAMTVTFAPPDHFLRDNGSAEARRRNRAVVLKVIPPLVPERVAASQSSGIPRVGRAGVNAAALVADILQPLTPDEELSVALILFVNTSLAFEQTQLSTDFLVDSSFSEEDLPSNLLGFYRAARGLSREDVERACDAWDPARSIAQLKSHTFVKNYLFVPPSLPPGGAWPSQFKTIQQEPPGRLWELRELILRFPGATIRTCYARGDNVPCKS